MLYKVLFLLCLAVALAVGRSVNEDDVGDEVLQNPDLFEGDILGYEPGDRNAVSEPYRVWPNGKIPYTIDPLLKDYEPLIKEAMKHYEDRTCIRFVPQTDERQYVRIFKGRGCYSHVGKTLSDQPLSLGPGCHKLPLILHELGHAIGFYHEHSRSDRDDYLNIHYENIQKGVTGGPIGGSDSSTTEDDVGDKVLQDILIGDILTHRPAVKSTEPYPIQLWPNGKVPYVIGPLLKHLEPRIKKAMKQYEDRTCIRFVPWTDEKQYVLIHKGEGCWSEPGKLPRITRLSLADECHDFQAILHELGHALGVYHEHSRPDRDDYLNIHYENILEGAEYAFEKLKPNENLLLTPFDFDSIMLYGETQASRQPGLKTMTAKDGRKIKDLKDKPGLSKYDIIRINKLYKC